MTVPIRFCFAGAFVPLAVFVQGAPAGGFTVNFGLQIMLFAFAAKAHDSGYRWGREWGRSKEIRISRRFCLYEARFLLTVVRGFRGFWKAACREKQTSRAIA